MDTQSAKLSTLMPRITKTHRDDVISRPLHFDSSDIGELHLTFVQCDGDTERPLLWMDDARSLETVEAEACDNLRQSIPEIVLDPGGSVSIEGAFAVEAALLIPHLSRRISEVLGVRSFVLVSPRPGQVVAVDADNEEAAEQLCEKPKDILHPSTDDVLIHVGLIIRGADIIGTVRNERRPVSSGGMSLRRAVSSLWSFWPKRVRLGVPSNILVDLKLLSLAALYHG